MTVDIWFDKIIIEAYPQAQAAHHYRRRPFDTGFVVYGIAWRAQQACVFQLLIGQEIVVTSRKSDGPQSRHWD
jgi:hypothetical protein